MEKMEKLLNMETTQCQLNKKLKEYFRNLDINKMFEIVLNNNAQMRKKIDKIKAIYDIKEGYYE